MLDEERRYLIEEACGVFAVTGAPEAENLTYLGLHALQHRGQESAGICTRVDDDLVVQRRLGLVGEVFTRDVLDTVRGDTCIGHVRYSTTGESTIRNAQPITVSTKFGPLALAHNGNLTNAHRLKAQLESQGSIFGTTTDTEVIAHLVAKSLAQDGLNALIDALRQVEGAFSMVGLSRDFVVAVRDPYGVRPLVLGKLDGHRVIASEPSSFHIIGAEFERELEPGEMLVVWRDGREESRRPFEAVPPKRCVFELVYFSRPDNDIFGRNVYETRKQMGRFLADESPVDADVVIPVPDSGVPAALGYAERSGIPFEMGLVRSHYVGRTFIEPTSSIRDFGVKLKLAPVRHILKGKRVIAVDDSIVRGTTSRKIIKMLREAGAAEVHFRVASPRTTNPCFYGIDTPEKSQLIAANKDVDQTRDFITADSLAYLTIDGLRAAVDANENGGETTFCEACFTGEYPIELADR